jgi:hypothetical protein
LIEK